MNYSNDCQSLSIQTRVICSEKQLAFVTNFENSFQQKAANLGGFSTTESDF
jgi:hypothetical protein